MNIDDNFFENHQTKCRCCFKSFGHLEKSIKITKIVESQFFDLTQLRLKSSAKKYSQNICKVCCDELECYSKVRSNFLLNQKKLYEFVDRCATKQRNSIVLEPEPTLNLEIKQEVDDFEAENYIIVEPIIKTEEIKVYENEFQPLENLYNSDDSIKIENHKSDSSVGPFDEFFKTKPPKKRKKRKPNKPKSEQIKREVTWYYCPHCDRKFNTNETLQNHIDSDHFNLKNCKCDQCDFKTHKLYLLKGHIRRVHDRTLPIPSAKGQPKTSCPICGLLVQKVSSHIRNVHTKPKNVFCDICGFGIFNLNRLRRHMTRHLSKETKFSLEIYKCDLCGAVLHSKNSIKAHMNNIHLESDGKGYRCYCGRTYKAESYLKIHQKTHEKQATHKCNYCDKKFMNPSQMKLHMEIHERKSKKNYPCEICGGMYASLNLLQRHKIFHTEPKHPCPHCGKKYHRPCLVERHVRRQHEIEETPCQFCGKMLNVLSMTRHVKEFHSGLPRLNCPIPGCTGTYLRRFHLKDHMQRSHKDYLNLLTPEQKHALDQKINEMNLL